MSTAAQPAPDFRSLLETSISWTDTGEMEIPWRALTGGHKLAVRLNDFPDEALYSLLVDGSAVADFDEWPADWTRPVSS
jgi:hypothetical protein